VTADTEWTLKISNLTDMTISLEYTELLAMPKTTVDAYLYCYGNLIASGSWSGVQLGFLLDQVGVEPETASVEFKAQDGYFVSIPIELTQRSDVIVAYELDDIPLPETLRLVVPEENGDVWIAMIISIHHSLLSAMGSSNSLPALQKLIEPESVKPKNESGIQSFTQSTDDIQTLPQTPMKQDSSQSEGASFPPIIKYEILAATIAVMAIAGCLMHRKSRSMFQKRTRSQIG
jgi:hypothetical protein